ncbi:hypothetical protein [Pseudomonas fragariae (ex Marin et al. 2024)]|uniref:Binary cytotoxin component n=2 Tax=Pseudomonas fragariae (ex Marin et al. 2024) TaxID=3080056 RepID=A0ABU5AY34_9PSED|nr:MULTISPECIES: hypothetical protein [unclassified Pseudomonas]MCW6054494.1 hypothetical protein [Pseudomonas fragi]MDV0424561.1 hypothetical protein [Pseudomonas sp. 17]MDX9570320.1 hypothetical protein [Pseudomonas sp. 21(2023)]MDX9584113.1 hypothetical protein [Pseudomonas sp. 19(2023)]MDX9621764.1 hypothetical protein [Pseudomonas sp. 20]
MRIPEHIIQVIQANPLQGATEACDYTLQEVEASREWTGDDYEILLECLAIVSTLKENELIYYSEFDPVIEPDLKHVCTAVAKFLTLVRDQLIGSSAEAKLENLKKQMSIKLTNSFSYEFTDGDLARVQTLVNELRTQISSSTNLEQKHRQRLLRRLEKLQSELHKKVSDLDNIYGLIGDAGVVLGKLGKDAQPIVERIRELTNITWRTQARAEELSSDTPLPSLGQDDDTRSIS